MTRKDYVLIAAALREALHQSQGLDADNTALSLVTAVADSLGDNPRFDRDRFLKACGAQS
jgi:hypothetical protein